MAKCFLCENEAAPLSFMCAEHRNDGATRAALVESLVGGTEERNISSILDDMATEAIANTTSRTAMVGRVTSNSPTMFEVNVGGHMHSFVANHIIIRPDGSMEVQSSEIEHQGPISEEEQMHRHRAVVDRLLGPVAERGALPPHPPVHVVSESLIADPIRRMRDKEVKKMREVANEPRQTAYKTERKRSLDFGDEE